jgi:LAS superfamily LD-carboxypeptidase LdcB
MAKKKPRSRLPVIICVALLGAAAVALLYGPAVLNFNAGETPLVAAETEPTTEPATEATTAPPETEATEAPTEPATAPPTQPATEAPDYGPPPTVSPAEAPIWLPTEPTEAFAEVPMPEDFPELTLVNAGNPLPDDYAPSLAYAEDAFLFDARAVEALLAMLFGAREAGLSPMICSAYRSATKQLELYNEKVDELVDNGYSMFDAEATAKTIIAYPGASEHNLGLAVDIVASYDDTLDRTQADTPEIQWLTAHCAEYGFILRYPEDKSQITGIMYEPWHFRYVGKEDAKEIMERGICLEEYLA